MPNPRDNGPGEGNVGLLFWFWVYLILIVGGLAYFTVIGLGHH